MSPLSTLDPAHWARLRQELIIDRIRKLPMPPSQPETYYRLRVTVNGFTCHHETWDHALEVDGKRDEVWIQTDTRLLDGNGGMLGGSHNRTVVMGDSNGFPDRVNVGSASPLGGIMTGDRYPAPYPWVRGPAPRADRLPLVILDDQGPGTLQHGVMITPTICEYDGGTDLLNDWGDSLARAAGPIAGAITGAIYGPATGFAVRSALDLGLPALHSLMVDWLGTAGDRPIGMRQVGETNRYEFHPTVVAMTPEAIRTVSQTDFGYGRGVIGVRYTDAPRLAGDYTVYIQVEYYEYEPQNPG